jgi:predicted Zn-dependent peptidase
VPESPWRLRWRRILAAMLLVSVASGGPASPAAGQAPAESLEKLRLRNGLEALVRPLPGTTEVALAVAYSAGSAFEEEGSSGLAHLVEHLTFHGVGAFGSRDWPREQLLLAEIALVAEALAVEDRKGVDADFDVLASGRRRLAELVGRQREMSVPMALQQAMRDCGASDHGASTGRDFVVFVTVLPPDSLACALEVEARRMGGGALRAFLEEQRSVLEELADRHRDPRAAAIEDVVAAAWPDHPYGRSNWGSAAEIRRLTPEQADAFFSRFYAPQNAIVAVAGQVRAGEALAGIRGAFEGLAAGERAPPLPPAPGIPPAVSKPARGTPAAAVAWKWPPRGDADLPALQLLAQILTIRLRQSPLLADPAAHRLDVLEIAAGGSAGALTVLRVEVDAAAAVDGIDGEIDRQIEQMRLMPVLPDELTAARAELRRRLERILRSPAALARELALVELQGSRAEAVLALPEVVDGLTADDLLGVARRHLVPGRLMHMRRLPEDDL